MTTTKTKEVVDFNTLFQSEQLVTQPTEVKSRLPGLTSLALIGLLTAGAVNMLAESTLADIYLAKVKELSKSEDKWLAHMYDMNIPEAKEYVDSMAHKVGEFEKRAKGAKNTKAIKDIEKWLDVFETYLSPNEVLLSISLRHKLLSQEEIKAIDTDAFKRIKAMSANPTEYDEFIKSNSKEN